MDGKAEEEEMGSRSEEDTRPKHFVLSETGQDKQ